MKDLKPISEGSSLAASAFIDNLTDEQFNDMLREFRVKADSIPELFSSLDSRISAILDNPAGSTLCTTITKPVITFDDMVQAFKLRELERLDLGYIISTIKQEVY